MVSGLPKLNQSHEGACKDCAVGKNTKGTFQNSISKTKNVLELVHFDLCGPMSVPSMGRFLYYIIFLDDLSRKTLIYFLKCKESDEILKRFKEFKALVENMSENKIKTLRIDNGRQYTSEIFKEFCVNARIKGEFIVPFNPLQNGVSERRTGLL